MADSKRCKVVLDTNFLVDMARFRIEPNDVDELLEGRCEMVIPSTVMAELQNIRNKWGSAALKMVGQYGIGVVKSSLPSSQTDDAILELSARLAGKGRVAAATNDARLRKRLKALGFKTIYLRARKHLELR